MAIILNNQSHFSLLLLFLSLLPMADPLCPDSGPVLPTIPLLSFLTRIQETAFLTNGSDKNFDPKEYVDLSLKTDLSIAESAFDNLTRPITGSGLTRFVTRFMKGAGEDLVGWDPKDYVAVPEGFLERVERGEVREWAMEVHRLWRNLSRKVATEVAAKPERHTLLPLPEAVVVPGSRFREVYYWDSYWVIRGLLASKMYTTAKGIVTNLIFLIDKYGHVLNGARAYYTNRSQPPLLSSMIHVIYKRTGDVDLVKKSIPALLKEHTFWNSGVHNVTIQDTHGCKHNLSRYYAMWNSPRPESSTIDQKTASKLSSESDKKRLYRELASTAESGWDFSTRWMRNFSDLTTLSTTSIIPVDLNAYVLKMELDISFFAKVTGDHTTAVYFYKAAQARKKAITSVLWNDELSQWFDYWLDNENSCQVDHKWKASNQNRNIFASNFIPLWIEAFHSDEALVDRVMNSLKKSGLVRAFGIATSLTNSGQQWDFPNGWAPMQHMIVEGLARSGSKKAKSMAHEIAVNWIRTNRVAYVKSGSMHEKYDVEKCGEFGGGGEYIPQTGFGWSNGAVLALLEEFGWAEGLKIDC